MGIAGVLLRQAGITYLLFLNALFQTAPIGWDDWLRILSAGLATSAVVEALKRAHRLGRQTLMPAEAGSVVLRRDG